MMIENGGGYQQKNGQFNEGDVSALDFAIAPETASAEFECRISLKAVYDSDGQSVYTGEQIGLALQLISSSWATLDTAPLGAGLAYTIVKLPPLSLGPLQARLVGGKVEVSWTGQGVLEAKDNLASGHWVPLTNATSPYLAEPTAQQLYFRLRL
jgi:hypothetical protein